MAADRIGGTLRPPHSEEVTDARLKYLINHNIVLSIYAIIANAQKMSFLQNTH